MREESLTDKIDGSLEEAHRGFAKKFQDWTGVSGQKLAGLLYATSATAALGYFATHLSPGNILLPVIATINSIRAVRPFAASDKIVKSLELLIYAVAVPACTAIAAKDVIGGDFSGVLYAIWPASMSAANYICRAKLNPPGEGKIHKAITSARQYLSNLIPVPAPAQTL